MLRPMSESDRGFLERVYASTRAEELAPVPWTMEQKAAFLSHQFAAQHAHYQQHYAGSEFLVVEEEGRPVGRFYVARWAAEIRIIDIALIPEARGRGIGESLLRGLLAEARELGKPVTIHVERQNRALRLYERLGFGLEEDKGVYLFLKWRPGGPSVT